MTHQAAFSAASQSAASAPDLSRSILADQINAVQSNVGLLMWGNMAVAFMAAWMLQDAASPALVLAWLAAQVVNGGFNLWGASRIARRPATVHNAARRAKLLERTCAVSGLLWTVGVVMLWTPGHFDLQVLLMFLVTGLTGTALHSLHAYQPGYLAFLLPCLAGVFTASFMHGGSLNYVITACSVIYGVTSWRFSARMSDTLIESMRRRYEVAELAQGLQAQKARAEEASQSKSRFLAAASHDLRQPVHALSLFVGALGQQNLSDEARRLLGHVSTSVEALGSMFNALLDISKLDASMVKPEISQFDLKAMLERICHEEGTLASAKGLTVRVNSPKLWVASDPALLERVLRNLISNAVRYTEIGGVLVAARRRGANLVVRVIDTGIGIPADRQAEVFREFVQLGNRERDRNKGLGLGLAIVRRLCTLLGLDLSLQSNLARGSNFKLQIPVSELVMLPLTSASNTALFPENSNVIGHGELVLVIDDDTEILDGMQALLTGWGCHVVAATGLDELMPSLARLPQVPKVIISDYRLRGNETGLALVEHLRSEYNDDIPAILITGDTAPDRLHEAQESGLTLLHKPVTPQELRHALAAAYWPRVTRRSVERTSLAA
jgi:two-component system, sensor histidine kinase